MNTHYDTPLPVFNKKEPLGHHIILVTGIAQPQPLADFITENYKLLRHFDFPDHHNFSSGDIRKIIDFYQKCALDETSIVFTEKDFMRIRSTKLQDILMDYPVFFQPITYKFAHNGSEFDSLIRKVIDKTEG
jgi:tetraacyldisaccharide 4'-kinase